MASILTTLTFDCCESNMIDYIILPKIVMDGSGSVIKRSWFSSSSVRIDSSVLPSSFQEPIICLFIYFRLMVDLHVSICALLLVSVYIVYTILVSMKQAVNITVIDETQRCTT